MSEAHGPDVEGALKDYLRGHAAVLASEASSRTFLAVTKDAQFPYILVTRFGGGEDASTAPVDIALIQIDVYGRVRQLDETNVVRAAVRQALKELELAPFVAAGKARLIGANVRDERRFSDATGQDPDGAVGERPRYIITAEVVGVAV